MPDIINFIDGKHVQASENQHLWSVNPATENRIASVNISSAVDVEKAVNAAKSAFESGPWPRMTVEERAEFLHLIADAIEENLSLFASRECEDTGFLLKMCEFGHLPRAVEHFRFFAEEGKRFTGQSVPVGNAYINFTRHAPLGVVAIMTPWNGPLSISSINLAAALITGNTVVLKPSELAPVTVSMLGTVFEKIGLPPGVVNIIHGGGEPTGQALIKNKNINMFCFIGGTEVGRQVLSASQINIRRSLLELGGKSPTVILEDACLEDAVNGALVSAFSSNGQVCTAGSRIIVHKSLAQKFCREFEERVDCITVGDPTLPDTEIGPMISREHRDKVLQAVARAKNDGALLRVGGYVPDAQEKGFYFKPAVFTGVHSKSELAQKEIFGPVVCVLTADDEKHALQIANDTRFGLAGSVWSSDISKALRFSNQLNAGNIGINTPYIRDIRCPFGGFNESGIGEVGGQWSLKQYTQAQTICVPVLKYDLHEYGKK